MKKSKTGYLTIAFLLVCALWYLFLPVATCSAEKLPEQITISRTQYLQLTNIISEQENLLVTLEVKLNQLEQTSPELLAMLSEQKALLAKTQERLQSAENLLALSEIERAKLNESLQTLSEQIKKKQAINRRRELQKGFWGTLGGVLVGKIM